MVCDWPTSVRPWRSLRVTDARLLDNLAAIAALPRVAALPEMGRTLRLTERLSAPELLTHQLARVERLLDHAARTVPLYRERFRGKVRAPLSLEQFQSLPLLTRSDLRDRAAELMSCEPPAGYHFVREAKSSGSTGVPITVRIDAVSEVMRRVLTIRDHAWHRRDPTQKLASIRAIADGSASAPHGRRDASWSHHPRSGPVVSLDVSTPVRLQLDWLRREEPAYLATYGSNAAALIALLEEQGGALPGLREVCTFAEVLPEGTREACRRVLGVPLADGYSTSEVGIIAVECPEAKRYHVQAEHVLVEVLRDDGSPCEDGEVGRVVITALHAFAMPLIRYELGDFAAKGGACVCGRGLPVIERICGRARNMLVLPDGDRYWPRFGSIVLGDVAPLQQFRLIQKSSTVLELEVVVARELTLQEQERVKALVLGTIGHPFELRIRSVPVIPRSPGGKFEDFVSEVAGGGTPGRPYSQM